MKSLRLGLGFSAACVLLVACIAPFNEDLLASSNDANDTSSNNSEPENTEASPSALASACAALPIATGNIIDVSPNQSAQLHTIVSQAETGTTLLLADGEYNLAGSMLWFAKPGVTLRSASGNPEAVILNGGYASTEVVTVAASDVTIAEITIKQAYTHGIHVVSSSLGSTLNTLIYRVHVTDSREQAIKINPHNTSGVYADQGEVACSVLTLTDSGRPFVNPTSGGCYTGGIDAHQAKDWVVRDNHFEGFWCPSGLSEHAVHFWRGGANTLVERNTFKDNARAIGFGLANSGSARTYSALQCSTVADSTYVDHYSGVIRNNVINNTNVNLFDSASGVDCSICLWSACDATVVHNTQYGTSAGFSSIEWRFAASQNITIANNIVSDALRARENADATQLNNLVINDGQLFTNATAGDFTLQSSALLAIDQGAVLQASVADDDFTQTPRDSMPDIGAFEVSPLP